MAPVFSTLLLAASPLLALAAPQVQLGNTNVKGADLASSQQELFAGLPFAEAPVGAKRFKAPVSVTTLSGANFDATKYGPLCIQNVAALGNEHVPPTSEDCLKLNVLRPAGTTGSSKLPVMIFLHGGKFESYGSDSVFFNGTELVSKSVERGTPFIYVSTNYRLGPLGFPQGEEAKQRGALNLGLKDQLAALKWIQSNIEAFGGDKSKVTLYGHSAGAISAAIHQLNPDFGKLASGVIMESGSAASTFLGAGHVESLSRGHDWDNFVAAVPQCASKAGTSEAIPCLQGVSDASVFVSAWDTANAKSALKAAWKPIVDGKGGVIPDLPSRIFATGNFAKLPFIDGTNLDEGTSYGNAALDYTTDVIRQNLTAQLSAYGDGSSSDIDAAVSKLLELYPDNPALGSPFGSGNETFGISPGYKRYVAIEGDIMYQSLARFWRNTVSAAGVPVYGYKFADPQTTPPYKGVYHAAELAYAFGALESSFKYFSTPKNLDKAIALSADMMDYYLSFITSRTPNDAHGNTSRPKWTAYNSKDKSIIHLEGGNTKVVPDTDREAQMAYIIANPVVFGH